MPPRLIPALIAVLTLLAPPLRAEVVPYAAPSGAGQVLTIYSSLDNYLAAPLIAGFQARNPGVAIRSEDLLTGELHDRILTETDTGRATADFGFSFSMDLRIKLATDGCARQALTPDSAGWPRWANWRDTAYALTFAPAARVYYPPAFRDRPGRRVCRPARQGHRRNPDGPQGHRSGEMSGTTPSRQRLTRRPDGATLVIAVILAAVAALIWIGAARLPQAGGYAGVGPADVPRWFALGLAGLSLWSTIEPFAAPSPRPAPQNVSPILWIVAGLAAQLALLTTAGFSIVTGVLFAAAARAFGRRNLLLTVPLGIAFSLAIYLVFAGLPKLSLPAGPLERTVWALTGGA